MTPNQPPPPGQPEYGRIEPGHVPAGYLTERPSSPWGSRLVHWAATAAVLAAVVCLVGWPWPTLYALGLLAGASILLAGIRLLLTERRGEQLAADRCAGCTGCGGPDCAERPEASGCAPETARTIPDADGEQRDDPAGDHPDDLRNRIATAIRDADDHWCSDGEGADAGALAGAVLAELAPELDELAALHHGEEPYTDEATVPTPSQWIWRWNHATPLERLEYAARAIARTDRLAAVYAVLIHASTRLDLTAADVNARIRAALDGTAPHLVHPTTEQQASSPQQVDEFAGARSEVVHETPITPPLTGPMIPAVSPTCGSNLPSTDGIPCAEPAAWHIRWKRGADSDTTFPASLACPVHMAQIAAAHAWYDRHRAGPACSSADATWQDGHCVTAEGA